MTDLVDRHDAPTGGRVRARRWPWIVAVFAVAAATFVLVWFEPHKLFIDDRVDEPIPAATPSPDVADPQPGDSSTATLPSTEPLELARGEFASRDHGTSGTARVLELAAGRSIVRLEGLDTDNGPDLYVYLTAASAEGDEGAFDDDFLDLGRLKGNQGDQNYDLPPDADLDRYPTVVIWCDRFDSAFGAADLTVA
jgi:hypothetical protein